MRPVVAMASDRHADPHLALVHGGASLLRFDCQHAVLQHSVL